MIRYLQHRRIRAKRVILRVDFNVPVAGRKVLDDYDIRRALPTIRMLLAGRNVIVILSHHSDAHQSLRPLLPLLERQLGQRVRFSRRPLGAKARALVWAAEPGSVFLAENVRFWPGEKKATSGFARTLARLGEVFVNDAFGELHRPYASMVLLPRLLPSFAGPLIAAELEMLDGFVRRPARPLAVIVGGAKLETKLAFLGRFSRLADCVLIGGAVANELLAGRYQRLARRKNLLLPLDGPAAGSRMLDIGPKTVRRFLGAIRQARTIIWNGPLGVTEEARYRHGTAAIARTLARHPGRVLIGGGDTVAFVSRIGLLKRFQHVSTGGGAMLAYLAGRKLPGLEALKR